MTNVRIVKTGLDRVEDLGPLWRSLHEHHHAVGADVPGIPLRDPEDSWARRRAEYLEWLAEPGAFVLLAEDEGRAVGYALVTMHEPGDDTHVTRERFAELKTLSVLEGRRGAGIGTSLLEAVFAELRAEGVRELLIGVLAANRDAARLYERYGFRPWHIEYLGTVPDAPRALG
jgi:GNAT superfamily N-acetyltransferase